MKVALFKGTGAFSQAIRWQTRSPYSHAGIILGSGRIIEAWHTPLHKAGAVYNSPSIHTLHPGSFEADLFGVATTAAQTAVIESFLLRQVGKKYDFTSVFRFVSRRQETRKSSGKWFCSELVFAAFQEAGINLLERIEPWAVSPGHLALSPKLVFLETRVSNPAKVAALYEINPAWQTI